MKHLLLVLPLLLLVALPLHGEEAICLPDTVENYREILEIHKDGSLTVTLNVTPLYGREMALPIGFDDIEAPKILGTSYHFGLNSAGKEVPIYQRRGASFLHLVPSDNPVEAQEDSVISVTFKVPAYMNWEKASGSHGIVRFSRTFLNHSDFFIRHYSLHYQLPTGYLLHDVSEVEPSYDPAKQPVPPYEILKTETGYQVALHEDNLGASARAMLQIKMVPQKKSLLPLIIGAILALLYLLFFRDVLKKDKA